MAYINHFDNESTPTAAQEPPMAPLTKAMRLDKAPMDASNAMISDAMEKEKSNERYDKLKAKGKEFAEAIAAKLEDPKTTENLRLALKIAGEFGEGAANFVAAMLDGL